MPASVVQERETSTGSAPVSSLALAYASNLTVNSSLHVFGSGPDTITLTAADSANGALTSIDSLDQVAESARFAQFVRDRSAAGADTVTLTPSASASFVCILIREIGATSGYDGIHPTNQQNPIGSTAADAVTSGTGTPTQPGLISALACSFTVPNGPSVGTGFTAGLLAWTGAGTFAAAARSESKHYASTAAIAATFTAVATTDNCITLAALFKDSAVDEDGEWIMHQQAA